MTKIPVFVGECNPYGELAQYALYPNPPYSAGGRLQRLVCGVPLDTYLAFRRHNLCVGSWSMPAARAAADILLRAYADQDDDYRLVLLGRKVTAAFFPGRAASDLPAPFTTELCRYSVVGGRATEREPDNVLVLPHPSGLCRQWQVPGTFKRAQEALRGHCPGVPFGWCT